MGITIESKSYQCDMGYFGFRKFRVLVANKAGEEIGRHYLSLSESITTSGKTRETFFEKYDLKTEKLIKDKFVEIELADFLYKSDCKGRINKEQVKKIYEIIKNEDDKIVFGYSARENCATMKDIKRIFSEGTMVEWQ